MKYLAALLVLLSVSAVFSFELHFYLNFVGKEIERGSLPNNFTRIVEARASTQQFTSEIDPFYGVLSDERFFCGPIAIWNTVFNQVDEIYTYTGNITFADRAHVLHFTVVSFSRIDQWHNLRHGAGYANVTSGEGYFKEADGRLAWTATHDVTNNVWGAHVTGSIWISTPPPTPRPASSKSKLNIGL